MKFCYDSKHQSVTFLIIGKTDTNKAEETKKVKERYERKLNEMQNELKKLNAAKKEHAKLVKNQSHYERQLKTLQHELGEMKKTKVCFVLWMMWQDLQHDSKGLPCIVSDLRQPHVD